VREIIKKTDFYGETPKHKTILTSVTERVGIW